MAFTRNFYDRERDLTKINDRYNNLNYVLNVPGNGTRPYFIDDPQLRLQKFGANLSDNMVDINSTLLGLNRTLCRDTDKPNNGRDGNSKPFNDTFNLQQFPSITNAITDESRLMMPAWTLRDQENTNWKFLHYNPQEHTEMNFDNNVSSRILEKDNYASNNSVCY